MGYILFSSKENFSIEVVVPRWNGIIEYSYDNNKWNEWNGEKIINNVIYMRGINNIIISNGCKWFVEGKNVKCQGNIENLLDYKSVVNNVHPKIEDLCFFWMFFDCESLIEAPQLLSEELSPKCYDYMFYGCSSLKSAPLLPNLSIAKETIINQHMLDRCSVQKININNKLYDINVLKLL